MGGHFLVESTKRLEKIHKHMENGALSMSKSLEMVSVSCRADIRWSDFHRNHTDLDKVSWKKSNTNDNKMVL